MGSRRLPHDRDALVLTFGVALYSLTFVDGDRQLRQIRIATRLTTWQHHIRIHCSLYCKAAIIVRSFVTSPREHCVASTEAAASAPAVGESWENACSWREGGSRRLTSCSCGHHVSRDCDRSNGTIVQWFCCHAALPVSMTSSAISDSGVASRCSTFASVIAFVGRCTASGFFHSALAWQKPSGLGCERADHRCATSNASRRSSAPSQPEAGGRRGSQWCKILAHAALGNPADLQWQLIVMAGQFKLDACKSHGAAAVPD